MPISRLTAPIIVRHTAVSREPRPVWLCPPFCRLPHVACKVQYLQRERPNYGENVAEFQSVIILYVNRAGISARASQHRIPIAIPKPSRVIGKKFKTPNPCRSCCCGEIGIKASFKRAPEMHRVHDQQEPHQFSAHSAPWVPERSTVCRQVYSVRHHHPGVEEVDWLHTLCWPGRRIFQSTGGKAAGAHLPDSGVAAEARSPEISKPGLDRGINRDWRSL